MLRQTRADAPVVLAVWLLLVCATTLLAAGAHYGDAIALGGLREAVLDAPPADRTTTVRTRAGTAQDVASLDAIVSAELERSIRLPGGEVDTIARSATFLGGPLPDGGITRLAGFEAIERHAALVDGRWAEGGHSPVEATLSEGAARALGLATGDTATLDSERGGIHLQVLVVGTWRPNPDDAFWLGGPLETEGVIVASRYTEYGPFQVGQGDVLGLADAGSLDVEWRALPNVDGLRADDLDATIADLRAVPSRLRTALTPSVQAHVTTGLAEVLASVSRAVIVSRSGVLILSLQFAVLAAYAVVLVAGVLVERRRPEVALLRSRGATAGHLAAMAVAESVLLAVSAGLVAPLLALLVVRTLGSVGPVAASGIVADVGIGRTTLLVTAIATIAAIVALSLPTLTSIASLSGVRAAIARQGGRTLPQRLGIDLALLVLAGVALWQLRLYGAPLTRNARGVLGVDPLLVAAPAIGLVAGAVLAIRLVPRLGEVAERLLERRRGAVAPLGGRQLARRPLTYSRSALLLMLAVSLGTFALAQSATWTRSQADQAAYRAVADVRFVPGDRSAVPTAAQAGTLRAVPGVEAATPVIRQRFDVRRTVRGGDLLAVDASLAATVVLLPPEAVAAGLPALLDQLAAARPAIGGVALAGQPVRVAVTIDAALAADLELSRGLDLDPEFRGIRLGVVVEDADGRLYRAPGGSATLVGEGQRIEARIVEPGAAGGGKAGGEADGGPAWPLRLVAVELSVSPGFSVAVGSIEIVAVESSEAAEGDAWDPVGLDAGAPGWGWERTDQATSLSLTPPAGRPAAILLQRGGRANGPVFENFGGGPTTFRLSAPERVDASAAIVGPAFLEQTGLAVGDTVTATSLGRAVPLRIAGSAAFVPPLDPDSPFAVVDRQTLERVTFDTDAVVLRPAEWWLALAPGAEPGVVRVLRGEPFSADELVGRAELTAALSSDPIGLGVIGALAIGTAAALVFAAIGFLVSAASSANERFGEFALLRALGLSGRELGTWLSLENAFLLGIGLVAGSGLGLVLAWVVLPVSTLTDTGATTVPPAVVIVPWPSLAPIWLLAGVLLVVSVAVVGRTIRAVRISSVLRARDG